MSFLACRTNRSDRSNRDVEVEHFLAIPELLVKGDSWVVAIVGLNKDDPGATTRGDLAQVLDKRGCDAPSSMLRADCQVVDIQLSPSPLELVEFVSDEPA